MQSSFSHDPFETQLLINLSRLWAQMAIRYLTVYSATVHAHRTPAVHTPKFFVEKVSYCKSNIRYVQNQSYQTLHDRTVPVREGHCSHPKHSYDAYARSMIMVRRVCQKKCPFTPSNWLKRCLRKHYEAIDHQWHRITTLDWVEC